MAPHDMSATNLQIGGEHHMAKIDDRCANCGGKFGLVCHRHWGLRFCRKVCKTNYLAKTAKDYVRMRKWFGMLARAAT